MIENVFEIYKASTVQQLVFKKYRIVKVLIILLSLGVYAACWLSGQFIFQILSIAFLFFCIFVILTIDSYIIKTKFKDRYVNRFRIDKDKFKEQSSMLILEEIKRLNIRDLDLFQQAIENNKTFQFDGYKLILSVFTVICYPILLLIINNHLVSVNNLLNQFLLGLLYITCLSFIYIIPSNIRKANLYKTNLEHYKDFQSLIFELRLKEEI